MCVKTTETSRCQRCGSEFDWLSDGTKVHVGKRYFESDSLLCLERQLNAANTKIKRLEEFVDQLTNPKFTRDDLPKEALLQRIKRLEEAGDALKASGYFGGWADAVNKWVKVKEAKP